jgi:hypothetical protein
MTGFCEYYKSSFELRNIILITWSVTVFALIWSIKGNSPVDFYFAIASILLLFIFSFCALELLFYPNIINNLVYTACLWIFGISVILASIMHDVNVIVASATLLLVVITAYSVQKTNEIAQKQLKLQNDPLISIIHSALTD